MNAAMKLSTCDESESPEIQRLFVKAFSDSEGPAEGEAIGRLVFQLMNETNDRDFLGFVAKDGAASHWKAVR